MALEKQITLSNGVPISYHRVVSVNIITNVANLIEVCGYTSQAKREEERAALAANAPMDVFLHTETYETPYDQAMTVESAYGYLKTLDAYEGAVDVLEEVTSDG